MSGNERRVLIIESDDEIAGMVERFLRANRFEVARARDLEQGKWLASLVKPQVALIDSEVSGFDTGRDPHKLEKRLKQYGAFSETPVVIIVPEGLDDDNPALVESLRGVSDGFLYKPFADTDLLRVVENFTGFDDVEERNVESALDNLLNERDAAPELVTVARDIKQGKNGKMGKREGYVASVAGQAQTDAVNRIKELEAELAEAKAQSQRHEERIADLMAQIRDLELDHSFDMEAMESDKKRLQDKSDELAKRIDELESSCAEAMKLLDRAVKIIKKRLKTED